VGRKSFFTPTCVGAIIRKKIIKDFILPDYENWIIILKNKGSG
jgi:hypothetical protein